MFKSRKEISDFIFFLDGIDKIYTYAFDIKGYKYCYWHLIRFFLEHEISEQVINHSTLDAKSKMSLAEKLNFVINAFIYRPKYTPVDILFLTPGVGDIDRGDYIENIYHDFFAHEIDNLGMKVGMLQMPAIKAFNSKRKLKAYSLNWIYIRIKLFSKLKSLKYSNFKDADDFLMLIERELSSHLLKNNLNTVISNLRSYIRRTLVELPAKIFYWDRVLNNYQPKYIVSNGVCYGGMFGIMSMLAKSNNIKVIENQHGVVSKKGVNYNYLCDKGYLDFLPDYFWAYGEKWINNTNLPMKKLAIGYPFLEENKRQYVQTQKYQVLLLPDSAVSWNSQVILKLIKHFNSALLRPHPRELPEAHQRYSIVLGQKNVTLDNQRDLVKSLFESQIVVAIGNYISMSLFETLAIGKKLICICDASIGYESILGLELIKDYIKVFDYRDSELVDKVQALLNETAVQYNTDDLYAPNWRQNIRDFFAGQAKL